MVVNCVNCPGLTVKNPNEVRLPVKHGRFYRSSDSRWIQRYFCTVCQQTFSQATTDPRFLQKKRRLNFPIFMRIATGASLRECARQLKCHQRTVARKLVFLGRQSECFLDKLRNSWQSHEVQFDDMETFEHSKVKPLSITLAVDKQYRLILGHRVSQMPAKGLLAKKARQKYGVRQDERRNGRKSLFKQISPCLKFCQLLESDQNPHYVPDIKKFFPQITHKTYKGRRGCVVGQGELKSGGFDPLFSLNHTCAMLRANINRLFRRTWNTTKKRENLSHHISIYSKLHNQRILKKLKLEQEFNTID